MNNLSLLRKLHVLTFCFLITQLTFAESPYMVKDIIYPVAANLGFENLSIVAEPIEPPTSVSASSASICSGNSVSLEATCSSGTVIWYNVETGGASIGSGSPLSQEPTVNTTYYAACLVDLGPARVTVNESARVSTGQVTVGSVPASPTGISANPASVLSGVKVTLGASCSSGSVVWYNQLSGGAALGMGSSMPYYPKATVTYYASCKSGNCESTRVPANTVNVTAMNLVPYLVNDVLLAPDMYGEMEDYPSPNSVNVNGIMYFRGKNTANGQELWKSDGTEAGTVLIKDIKPGTGSSEPENFLIVNGTVFFTANDGVNGVELWKTDGTPDGTVMVKNINPSGDSYPSSFVSFNDTLYFSARNNPNNAELWKSDGTEAGTVQVKDINTNGGSYPSSFVNHKGTLYFSATDITDGANNYELWKTDGTEAGTVIVKDINPTGSANVGKLKSIGDILYFYGSSLSNDYELWQTDGTPENISRVKDINPVTGPSSISSLVDLNGILLFSAFDGYGHELWRSNGTTDSTFMVKDIRPGDNGSGPSYLTNINGTVFFTANDGSDNSELWKTDGTTNGTVKVKEINTNGASYPMYLTNLDGTLYFSASNVNYNFELWKSDGTEAGTVLVKDLNQSGSSSPQEFRTVNGKLYFGASGKKNIVYYDKELWSLGTCTNANLIVSKTGKTPYYNSQAQPASDTLTCHCSIYNELISKVKATGANAVSGEIDAKEWVEESTPANYVRRHYEINPISGDTTTTGKVTLYFTQADFNAYNAITGSNTHKLPIDSSDASGISRILIERRTGIGNAETGLPDTYTKGIETINPSDVDIIWNGTASRWEVSFSNTGFGGFFLKTETISDPTAVAVNTTIICAGSNVSLTATCEAGTVVWYNQATGGSAIGTNSPLQVSISTSTTYYAACESGEASSNRVATDTVNVNPIPAIPTGVSVNKAAIINGTSVLLSATCSSGSVIWYSQSSGGDAIGMGSSLVYYPVSDITYYATCKVGDCESGRVPTDAVVVTAMTLVPYIVKDINPGAGNSGIIGLSLIYNILYFTANNADSGTELWKTDGTENGTTLVKDIIPGVNSPNIKYLMSINNTLYFEANDGVNGAELWTSDGTPNGTQLLKDIRPGNMGSELGSFTNVNGVLYFTADDGTNGTELWKSDGTNAGTVLVKNIGPGSQGSNPNNLINFKGTLYFSANDGTTAYELWKSDGTEAGTVLLKDINPTESSNPGGFIVVKNNIFFSATNGVNGEELWKTDGTEAGTMMVKDIRAGSGHSFPMRFGVIDSTLYFMAADNAGDEELWKSDGTEAGTVRVKNIRASGSSNPWEMTNVNGTLFFAPDDGINGKELWRSDGTDAGTTLVKNIRITGFSGIAELKNINNTLHFKANDGINGMELWKSDGTEAGTVMVKDIWSGANESNPDYLTVFNGKMYFRARTTHNSIDYGVEIWSTGTCTDANTLTSNFNKTLYYNRQVQPASATTSCHCDVFNNIISTTNAIGGNPVSGNITASVWIESVAPTTFVRRHYEINPESGDTTATGKVTLYFTQDDFDAYNSAIGTNVYKLPENSDDDPGIGNVRIERRTGTSNDGTGLTGTYTMGVQTIDPTDTDIIWNSTASRWEISFSNTGFGGFFLKSEIIADPIDVSVNATTVCEGSSVSLTATCETGTVVWYNQASGGSAVGTGSPLSQSPASTITYYAACYEGSIYSQRVATNEVVVTTMPTDPTSVSVSNTVICSGTSVSLSATCATGIIIWYNQATGGTVIGTGNAFSQSPSVATTYYASCKNGDCESSRVATDIITVSGTPSMPTGVSADKTAIISGAAVILNATCSTGFVVWYKQQTGGPSIGAGLPFRYYPDTTTTFYASCKSGSCESSRVIATGQVNVTSMAQVPYMIKNIQAGNYAGQTDRLTNVNGIVYFESGDDEGHGKELWKTDGTAAGTMMVKDIYEGPNNSQIYLLTNVNGTLFFRAVDNAHGIQLWKSDGTEAGTQIVKEMQFRGGSATIDNFINVNGTLYFTADMSATGVELWKSDGSESGTQLVKDINPGSGNAYPSNFINVDGILYFIADDGTNENEVWRTDGTEAGTVRMTNLGAYQFPMELVYFKGSVFYSVRTQNTFRASLWKSNGIPMGVDTKLNTTDQVEIYKLTVVNDLLFFASDDFVYGNELWKTDGTPEGTGIVKDIRLNAFSSSPESLINVNGTLMFTAIDNTYSRKLWKSNGTEATTEVVKNIQPGNGMSGPEVLLTDVNGIAYFQANDQAWDNELWQSDGTEAGTFRVKDLWPGYSSSPDKLVNANGKLFFRAGTILEGISLGYEPMALGTCTIANTLFSSNGKTVNYNSQLQVSPATTSCHCDIFNNLISTIDSVGANPVSGAITTKGWIDETAPEGYVRRHYEISPVSGDTTATGKVTLYFTNTDFEYYNDAAGSTTYKLPTDSSDAEAISKMRIERRTGLSNNDTGLPGTYTNGIETIDPIDEDIIWNSTASRWEVSFNTTGFGGFFLKTGTIQDPADAFASATTICEGGSAYLKANCAMGAVFWYTQASGGEPIDIGSPILVSPVETTIYYASCEDSLVISNRITADTVSITPYPEIPTDVFVNKTAIVNGTSVILSAICGSGNAVWYDQLSGGKAIGTGSPLVYYPASTTTYYASCKNSVCESSGERVATSEVVVTGADLVPYMVKDINSAVGESSSPKYLSNANGTLYFTANDGVHSNELWKSDALTGTTLIKSINEGNGGVSIENLIDVNGTTYFSIKTNTAFELWKTNGTEESTKMVKSIWGYSPARKLANFLSLNNILYFIAYDGETFETKLWRSDGTSKRTVIAQNLNEDNTDIQFAELVVMNGALYFPACLDGLGVELWKSDGANTTLVKEFFENNDGRPANLTVINNTLYFAADDGINGRELWKSDGTLIGTELVKDIFGTGESSDPTKLANVNGTLYFVANDGINERELMKSDGTDDGTVSVKYINEGEYESIIDQLTNVNGMLYFTATTDATGNELWISNGTSGGTRLVKDINPGTGSSDISNLINLNGTLYFQARNDSTNTELWKSDGTEDGTMMVKEIMAGDAGSLPAYLTNVNGKIFFSSNAVFDSVNYGTELWSLGTCTDENTIVSNSGKSLNFNSQTIATTTCHCDVFNNLVSTVNAIGGNPVSGQIDAKEWIESVTPTAFVRRHYEINPVSGDTTTTGKVTLYFTQADFDAYNTATGGNVYKLPADSSDASGIARILIERRTGTGNAETGLPGTYTRGVETINPDDVDIDWNSTASRWEVSFSNTGFGGFFLKTKTLSEPTSVAVNTTIICDGNSVSLTATCEAGTVVWYNAATGGSTIGTSSPLSQSPSSDTIYYALCSDGSVNSERVATDTVVVTAIPESPTEVSVNNTAICSGTAISLTATCATGTIKWFTQETGSVPIGTGSPLSQSPTVTTTYYASCITGDCASSRVPTEAVVVTAMPESPTGVSVNDTSICSGTEVFLNATCASGTITWYDQSSGGELIATGTSSQYPEVNTTYYASCKDDNCESSRVATSEVVVTTMPSSPNVSVDFTAICSGESVTLNTSCATGTVRWYNQLSGGSVIGTSTTLSRSPTVTTIYYASCKNGDCESSREASETIVVTAQPQNPSAVLVNNTAICSGTSVTLSTTCTIGTVVWYNQSEVIGTGTTISHTPTETTTYYASCKNGNCETTWESSDEVVVTTQPTIPTAVSVNNRAICSGTAISLTATCATGTIKWFTQETGSVPIGTGSPLSPTPTVTTTYYASCITGDCASSRVPTDAVVVTAIPGVPTSVSVSNTAICSGTAVSLTATCATGTIKWFTQETGSVPIGTGSPLSQSPTVTTTYYASCITGNCASSRVPTESVVVTAIPTIPTSVSVSNTAICSGTAVALTATCATGTIKWFTQETGSVPIGTGSPLSQSPTVTTTYYASCIIGDCASNRVPTESVVVTAIPESPTEVSVNNTAICSGTAVSLTATCATGTITWYSLSSGGTAIGTVSPLSQSPSISTTYYASCKNGNCESSRVATSQVVVTAQPNIPTSVSVSNTAICSGTAVSLTATCATGTITWYNQLTGGTAIGTVSPLSQSPSVSTTYYASCKNGNCESSRVATSQVVVTTQPDIPTSVSVSNTAICSVTAVSLTATCATGTITWYNQETGGSALGTGNGLSQSPSVTTTYYASCKNGICESNRVAATEVVVTLTPENPYGVHISVSELVAGNSVILKANCVRGTIVWYNHATGGSIIGTGNNLSHNPTATLTYSALCSNGDCISGRTATLQLVVSPRPEQPTLTADKTAICLGDSAIISGHCASINETFHWSIAQLRTNAQTSLNDSSVRVVKEIGTYKAYCEANGVLSLESSITITQALNCNTQNFIVISPADPTVCPNTSVTLMATGCSGTITWSGGVSTKTGTSYTVDSGTVSITYLAQCSTGGSSNVTVKVAATDEIVATDMTTGAAKVKATNSIESGKKVGDTTTTPAPNLSFEAGGSILLKPGFVVEQGAVFKAEIKTCN